MSPAESQDRLSDLTVLSIDCQTTGATPELGALLEMGWAIVPPDAEDAPAARAHWLEVPPPHRVSRIVRELTGFDDACRAQAIPVAQAWSLLRDDLAAHFPGALVVPTVIHFARFELAFLRDLQMRLEPGAPFPFDAVCLHEIARRLFPDLPRRSLRALAGYLGHSPEIVRRSAGHVTSTAFAWRALVGRLAERGVGSWSDLRAFLDERAPPRSSRRGFPITAADRRDLPTGPGVYRFVRKNGDVLYVGKAASIKKRVASHYGAGVKTTERALEMLTQAHGVVVTETATVLEAALLEVDEIKRLDPPYNVHLKEGERRAWFADRTGEIGAEPSNERPLGPFPSVVAVRGLGALIALLAGAAPSPKIRAAAVGVPEAFGPDEASFAEAWDELVTSWLSGGRTPWGRFVRGAKRLRGTEEPDSDDTTQGWDRARIVRHLERTLRGAGQLLRRARVLTILSESNVTFREVGGSEARTLVVRRGAASAGASGAALERPARASWRDRQRVFDAGAYDRLRVLWTEIVRVEHEGGDVIVELPGARLEGERVRRLLGIV